MNKREVIDIKFRGDNLEKRLSNLYPYKFVIDGLIMESFEGFIQSLRSPDERFKEQSYTLSGFVAWKKGQGVNWWDKQEVYWLGKTIDRQSEEYTNLITHAYDCMFEQNIEFKNSLKESLPYKLIHTIGKTNKYKTLLTNKEFLGQLNRLREKLNERKFFSLFN